MSAGYEATDLRADELRDAARRFRQAGRTGSGDPCEVFSLGLVDKEILILATPRAWHRTYADDGVRIGEKSHNDSFFCIAPDGDLVVVDVSFTTVLLLTRPVQFIVEGTPSTSVRAATDEDILGLDYRRHQTITESPNQHFHGPDTAAGPVVAARGDGLREVLGYLNARSQT